MNGVLVDSNILLDVLTEDAQWYLWSSEQLELLTNNHILFINAIIYAEVSVRFSKIEDVEQVFPPHFFKRSQIPWEAAFLAGKAFLNYKKKGGVKTSPLPDFLIGAHAAIDNLTLLTRDARRFQTYFPQLKIISPSHH